MITVCFLQSAEHYYASRAILITIIEAHALLFALQQDTASVAVTAVAADCMYHVHTNSVEHSVIQEMHVHISPVHPATTYIKAPTQKVLLPDNYLKSIVIPQAQLALFYPCCQMGVSAH